jgi:hypothetical protein
VALPVQARSEDPSSPALSNIACRPTAFMTHCSLRRKLGSWRSMKVSQSDYVN